MSRRWFEQTSGVVRAAGRLLRLGFEIVRGVVLAILSTNRNRSRSAAVLKASRRRWGMLRLVCDTAALRFRASPFSARRTAHSRMEAGVARNDGALRTDAPYLRALWLHHVCRRVLRIFDLRVNFVGTLPRSGLLVANHLSYLDILLLGSLTPCVFVAKSEVRDWPVFGWFARRAGTIFVNRERRRDAVRASEAIRTALRDGALVVLFPEGTSSDGEMVLPFKPSLLEGAIGERVPVSVAALRYELPEGNAAEEVCYWGKHTLVPHLLNLMTKRAVHAAVSFSPVPNTWRDRKKLAAQLHAEVACRHAALRSADCQSAVSRIGNPQTARNPNASRLPVSETADKLSALRMGVWRSLELPRPFGPVLALSEKLHRERKDVRRAATVSAC